MQEELKAYKARQAEMPENTVLDAAGNPSSQHEINKALTARLPHLTGLQAMHLTCWARLARMPHSSQNSKTLHAKAKWKNAWLP